MGIVRSFRNDRVIDSMTFVPQPFLLSIRASQLPRRPLRCTPKSRQDRDQHPYRERSPSCILEALPRLVLKPGPGYLWIYLFPTVQRRQPIPEFLIEFLQLLSTDPVVFFQKA